MIKPSVSLATAPAVVVAIFLLVSPFGGDALAQTKDQEKCINSINKAGSKVASAQGKVNGKCIKDAGSGKTNDADACIVADEKSKVSKAQSKVNATASDKCSGAANPPFGFTDAGTINAAAQGEEESLATDVFGAIVQIAILTDKDGAKCQAAASKAYEKYASTRVKTFLSCKKDGLKIDAANSSATLQALCMFPSDSKSLSKVSKAAAKIQKALDKKCVGVSSGSAFPGECAAAGDVAVCLAAAADCRTCLYLNAADGLAANCDQLDNGALDQSCAAPPATTTTTSVTTTTGSNTTTTGSNTTTTLGGQDPLCPIKGELVIFAGVTDTACSTNADCPVPPEAGGFCDTGLGMCRTATDLDTGWKGIAHDSDITDGVRVTGALSCPGPFDALAAEPCGECAVTGILPEPGNCRCSNNIRTVCNNPFELDPGDCTLAGVTCSVDDDCKRCSESLEMACVKDDECPFGEFCQAGLSTPNCINNQCVGTCNCYFGPPLALSAANVPACIVNRFSVDISGTANVDLGAGEISASLRSIVYLGELTTVPCPVCGGTCDAPAVNAGEGCIFDFDCDDAGGDGVCGNFDTVAGDGIREGTCVLGLTPDRPCDVDGVNVTFPFPGGGGHSLDCPPSTGKNVSGQGLVIDLSQTTGSVQFESNIECGFSLFGPPPFCQCGLCGGGNGDPCSGDEDCDPGVVCMRRVQGDPLPNDCGEAACVVDPARGGNNGICEGLFNSFCDGAFKSDGAPFVTCISNADCAEQVCGQADCGICTVQRPKPCFLETIIADGQADPEFPIGAALACIGPTSNTGINAAAGLPGPARIVNQARATTFCASDPGVEYTPGVGGCP